MQAVQQKTTENNLKYQQPNLFDFNEIDNFIRFFSIIMKRCMEKSLLNMNLLMTNTTDAFYESFKEVFKSLTNFQSLITIIQVEDDIVLSIQKFSDFKNVFTKVKGNPFKNEIAFLDKETNSKRLVKIKDSKLKAILKFFGLKSENNDFWCLEIHKMYQTEKNKSYVLINKDKADDYCCLDL